MKQFWVDGDPDTTERFRQYLLSNPAARRGWVQIEPEAIAVDDEYVEPFREIAANFGLDVRDPEAMRE